MKRKWKLKKLISLMLVFALLVQLIADPIKTSVKSKEKGSKDTTLTTSSAVSGGAINEAVASKDTTLTTSSAVSGGAINGAVASKGAVTAQIVGELNEKRTENSKCFMLSDQTFKTVVYQEAVHYKTKEGTFEEIDNTLQEMPDGTYQNKENDFHVSLAKDKHTEKLVHVKKKGRRVVMGILTTGTRRCRCYPFIDFGSGNYRDYLSSCESRGRND